LRRSLAGGTPVLLVAVAAVLPARLFAFPGSVRWGYANCTTCHFNVAGGGLLTPYGRQLSRELLSTWGSEKEAEFAYGALPEPAWLALGGDISLVATARADAEGEHVDLVQADLEAALTHGRLLAVATAGVDTGQGGLHTGGLLSRRHYVQVAATSHLSLRTGRFLPNFGVWAGDPFAATRWGPRWDRDTYNVEANWIAPQYHLAATAMVAGAVPGAETGVSLSGGMSLGEKAKVWLSAADRRSDIVRRRLLAASSVVGIGSHAYLLTEGVLQDRRSRVADGPEGHDLFANACFAYETVKGLYVLLTEEASRVAQRDGQVRTGHTYGPSLRWFPRSHIELQLRWRRRAGEAISPEHSEGVSLWVHFYP
jgi:hypothetical protein